MTEKSRFIAWPEVKFNIDSNIPFKHVISGNPQASIYFDAKSGALGVTVEIESDLVPSVEPANMQIESKLQNGVRMLVVQGANGTQSREFYSFLESFIDRVQNTSAHPSRVFDEAWSAWLNLLDLTGVLSEEKQRGLLGELIVLDRISQVLGFVIALSTWHDEANAEHDFALAKIDLEIKTTTNEERIHQIGSVSQLQPSKGRPLYLGSVQITRTHPHAHDSFSLVSKVSELRHLAAAAGCLTAFNKCLEGRGFNNDHERHYMDRYVLRSPLVVIPVDEQFPKITRPLLEICKETNQLRIVSVDYRVNLTGLDGNSDESQMNELFRS